VKFTLTISFKIAACSLCEALGLITRAKSNKQIRELQPASLWHALIIPLNNYFSITLISLKNKKKETYISDLLLLLLII
jgi:hypothetical protein